MSECNFVATNEASRASTRLRSKLGAHRLTESDWPKATHISADWGHNAAAVQVEIVLTNRDTLAVTRLKPNEHTNGAGAVSHHAEQVLPLGIYDGTVTYLYPFCASRTATFNGLNHGAESLPNINVYIPG